MNKYLTLAKKTCTSLKREGVGATSKRIKEYLKIIKARRHNSEGTVGNVADILFVNGCYLPHPHRYRVSHQMEELLAKNIVSCEVDYAKLSLDLVNNYRGFIFYRCPYTDTIGEFIKKAKELNKTVFYDIDDLVFDRKYTETVEYLKTMSEEERNRYYEGVDLMQQTLRLCDYGITTTEALADEMKKYVKEVYINRNCASDEMLALSIEAYNAEKKINRDEIVIGYFSGSITHNEDVDFIIPVLKHILSTYQTVKLLLAGEIDTPKEFSEYKDRIITTPFQDWRKLPKLIASVDINIVPLKDTLFNMAKSENKWTEAALVHVPTVASNVGAFKKVISNWEDGVLCDSTEQWIEALEKLILDCDLRNSIGDKAYDKVFSNGITITKSAGLAAFIREKLRRNIWFVIPMLKPRGGIGVALRHAAFLAEQGNDVTIINDGGENESYIEKDGVYLPVLNHNYISVWGSIDIAVGTLYSTMNFIISYPNIVNRCYLVQGYETNFVPASHPLRHTIEQTYNYAFPVKYLTISRWCQSWLREKYNKEAKYAPNGLDTKLFYSKPRDFEGKIRILIEGNSLDHYKNVDESFEITNRLPKEKFEIWYLSYEGKPKKNYRVDKFLQSVPYKEVNEVYRNCDILIKTSIFESFSYPPLEMMATGGFVVAIQNDGNSEYLVNEYNCLIYKQGDIDSAVQCIDRIVSDAELRKQLYENGIKTAEERNWENVKSDILKLYG